MTEPATEARGVELVQAERDSSLLDPVWVADQLTKVLRPQSGDRILDPHPMSKEFLSALRIHNASCKLTALSVRLIEPGSPSPAAESEIRSISIPPGAWIETTEERFEIVASYVPAFTGSVDLEALPSDPDGVSIRDSPEAILLLRSLSRLTPNGQAGLVVEDGFLKYGDQESVFHNLAFFGFHIRALISTREMYTTPVSSKSFTLIAISRAESPLVFVGEIRGGPERDHVLFSNLERRESSEDARLGTMVEERRLRPNEEIFAELDIRKHAQQRGLNGTELRQIATEIRTSRGSTGTGFLNSSNSVYFPARVDFPVQSEPPTVDSPRTEFIEVVFDPTRADARFVAGFMNTTFGKQVRDLSRDRRRGGACTVSSMQDWPVYLPPVETQREVLAVQEAVIESRTKLDDVARKAWEFPGSSQRLLRELAPAISNRVGREWIDRLPFPVASVLWNAWSNRADKRRWNESMFHFFQALCQFNASILLSAWSLKPRPVADYGAHSLIDLVPRSDIDTPGFGTWITVLEYLSGGFRRLASEGSAGRSSCLAFLTTQETADLEGLLSAKTLAACQRVSKLRNEWPGHGGAVNDRVVDDIARQLSANFDLVRPALELSWTRLHILLPIATKFTGAGFDYDCERVMGVSGPFERVRCFTKEPMRDGSLYLHNPESGLHLEVIPLIKIRKQDAHTDSGFFFNRKVDGGFRYISYHAGTESEWISSFPEVRQALATLWP